MLGVAIDLCAKIHIGYIDGEKIELCDENLMNYDEIVYHEINDEEFIKLFHDKQTLRRVSELKQFLSNTDYQAIKYAEGELSEEEYADMKAQRAAWRKEINELEKED